ncbi:MAG: class I SAM-dependent methyltransferase [Dehalococcoidia bacterium]|nr:class I SAM-dependent methyltransferase [Dehalococcoidia bacterium]
MSDALLPTAPEALAAWARHVEANREQAERLREPAPPADFYAPVAAQFRADPRRTDEPALDCLRSLVRPGDVWLDIGAGGGRYALPLALLAREVVAVDPSPSMLAILREGMAAHGVGNVRVVQGTWPLADVRADVAFIAHVGYDIAALGPFLDAMELAAGRLCVAVLQSQAPSFFAEPFWPPVHGEARHPLPALREFLALQLARGRLCEVRLFRREPNSYADRDVLLGALRQQLFVAPGSAKDARLLALAEAAVTERDGRWRLSSEAVPLGVVSWAPPA